MSHHAPESPHPFTSQVKMFTRDPSWVKGQVCSISICSNYCCPLTGPEPVNMTSFKFIPTPVKQLTTPHMWSYVIPIYRLGRRDRALFRREQQVNHAGIRHSLLHFDPSLLPQLQASYVLAATGLGDNGMCLGTSSLISKADWQVAQLDNFLRHHASLNSLVLRAHILAWS